MSTVDKTQEVDAQEFADRQAVFDHAFKGTQLDPEISRRVRQRAEAITEEIRRVHGLIDEETWAKIIGDDDDGDDQT